MFYFFLLNVYKDLLLIHNSNITSTLKAPQCIGGGFGDYGYIEIDSCVFESQIYADVSYHSKSWNPQTPQTNDCVLKCKDSVFKSTFSISAIGDDTSYMNKVYISNCLMKTLPDIRDRANIKFISWNNVKLENSTPSTVRVQSVTLSNNSLSLNIGDKTTLTANVYPSNATNKNVTWSSNNQNVITVSSNGEITAVNPGNATITVRTEDGGYTATCSITVVSSVINVTGVTLNQTNISANTIGAVYNLVATVNPSNATNKNVTWSTNNSSVASVNNGTVTINGEGNATITVTTEDGGYTATCLFTVSISEEVIIDNVLKTKSGDYLITKSGEYLAFKTPTSEPGGSEPGGSEPGGSEPGGSEPGGGESGGTGILIENLGVTGIINPMAVNQIVTLTIKYTPTDATERDVVWESLDTSALRIVSSDNNTCTIQPLKKGNSSLKVTAVKGGATKTFYFTTSLDEGVVAIESLGAKFETGASPMKVGSTATLTPKISPSNVTDSRVTWELIQQGEYARIESDYERCTITALSPGYFQIKISAVVGGASKVLYLQVIE